MTNAVSLPIAIAALLTLWHHNWQVPPLMPVPTVPTHRPLFWSISSRERIRVNGRLMCHDATDKCKKITIWFMWTQTLPSLNYSKVSFHLPRCNVQDKLLKRWCLTIIFFTVGRRRTTWPTDNNETKLWLFCTSRPVLWKCIDALDLQMGALIPIFSSVILSRP